MFSFSFLKSFAIWKGDNTQKNEPMIPMRTQVVIFLFGPFVSIFVFPEQKFPKQLTLTQSPDNFSLL